MNFLLDDGLGLDTVKQFCKSGFNVLAYVARHHKKEQVVTGFEQAFLGLGNDGKNSRLFFHLAADGVHFCGVVGNLHGCNRGMELGRALYPDLQGAPRLLLPQSPPDDLPAELCGRLEPAGDIGDALPQRVFLHMALAPMMSTSERVMIMGR